MCLSLTRHKVDGQGDVGILLECAEILLCRTAGHRNGIDDAIGRIAVFKETFAFYQIATEEGKKKEAAEKNNSLIHCKEKEDDESAE